MAAVTICSDFGAPQNKFCHCLHCFSIWHKVMGPNAMILVFWILSFKTTFWLSSFTSSRGSLVLHIFLHIWGYWYFPQKFWLQLVLALSSPAFLMIYSAYKLNKQGDNIQPWRTPFPLWNQSVVPCPVLTVASWPATAFSSGRSGGLVFSSLSEFSTVYGDPHSQ